MNKIMSVCDENGKRFDNNDVAEQFVKHFEGFLGINPEVNNDEIKKALFDIDDNKAPGPDGFTSRPIACCNVIYKCISKILTNGIKVALSHVMDDNQTAFIPGRAITDNFLLVQELLKWGKRLEAGRPNISLHLYYSYGNAESNYDLIMLCHGGVESVQNIKKALDKFSAISGLYPHLGKCIMFCGSLDSETKNAISNILPLKEGKLPVKYLGVPLVTKKIGIADCKQLIDKVQQKLMDWKNKSLSYAGRAQLITYVLASMQVYWVLCFCFLKQTLMILKSSSKDFYGILVRAAKNSGNSIASIISKKEIFYAGFNDQDYIADVRNENGWKWPQEWLVKYPWLKDLIEPILNNTPDKPIWVDNDRNARKFSTQTVCKDIRGNGDLVNWKDIVWHPNCIPKHTFIVWLAVKMKLSTQDKMLKWYLNRVFECSLCKKEADSHEHLFFKCEYAQKIWKRVCVIAKLKVKEDKWEDIIKNMSLKNDKRGIWGIIRRLCFAAVV
ncbi:RNA-directed DNA polymerase, eukaryota, reverse transcriptase zinc-binding domain protein [Tanacetum coccineum]|uniref:RNA-directed DNA polymerase, eukaryota, reverse transcriptase zinc-binding domain protein n=1 Tax=Tanacetum coccineum TaxID=301880 RepID=A0ABQ5GK58_9ASTR